MGKGRAPCCDKTGLKKGPWTPAEDMRLMAFIQKHGHGNWRALPKLAGLLRCGKSCRLRWTNYLRPDIKRGNFTMEEEETIIKLHELLGNKWSKIASHMPGRTDNEIKNVWNTHLKKRVVSKGPNHSGNKEKKQSASSSSSSSSSSNSSISSYHDEGIGMRNEEQEHQLSASESPIKVMESKLGPLVETVPMKWSDDFWDMLDDRNSLESNNISDTYLQRSSISNGMSPVNEPMELTSFSSSSTCSSHVLQTNQVDGYGPEDHVRPPINFERPCELHDWVQEVIKQDTLGEKLEIPYEPNLDFWDMLGDDLGFFKSSGDTMYEVDEVQHSTLEEEYKKEVENMKWVAYLENELGLQATSDDNKGSLTQETVEPQVSNSSCEEILVKAEIDPVATYFQMCPYKSKF